MSFVFKKTKYDAIVFLVVHHSDERDMNGTAAGSYVASFSGGGLIWGRCSVKNSETIHAYALDHIIQHHFENDGRDEFLMQIFVPSDGFKAYFNKYVPGWIANHGLNSTGIKPDAYDQWKRTYLLLKQGCVRIDRLIRGEANGAYRALDEMVKALTTFSLECRDFSSIGLIHRGEGVPPCKR